MRNGIGKHTWEPAFLKKGANISLTPVHFSVISCVICIFRPIVVTGAWTCHLTISQILNKSTKISKNQNKPTQLPVTTTCRKMQYCWNSNRYEQDSRRRSVQKREHEIFQGYKYVYLWILEKLFKQQHHTIHMKISWKLYYSNTS